MRSTTGRAREVAVVLLRQGLGSLLDLFDLGPELPQGYDAASTRTHAGPVHLRRALEELGPTFVKLGQVLSTRPDLVPPEYETELARLQDSAPTVASADIVAAVEAALGRPLDDAYAHFDLTPMAAASIGQVHAATLPDGSDVVVKVRRPHVMDQVHVDLELLDHLGGLAARRSARIARYDPVGLVHEFGRAFLDELDYTREGHNAELIADGFAGDARVHIPAVHWGHTRADVITEERIHGTKIDDAAALDAAGIDRSGIAHLFVDSYLSMVFVHGFFHADPHPGNVFVESADRIGFVDFGMVGRVGAESRRGLGAILLALVADDAARMADGLLRLGIACDDVDRAGLERDLAELLRRYARAPLEQLRIGPLLGELMHVVRAHRLRLPSELALLIKTVMMCEGVAAHLDPGFELVPLLVPYASRLIPADQP